MLSGRRKDGPDDQFVFCSGLASSDTAVSSDLVRLFKALGGGWSATVMLPEQVTSSP